MKLMYLQLVTQNDIIPNLSYITWYHIMLSKHLPYNSLQNGYVHLAALLLLDMNLPLQCNWLGRALCYVQSIQTSATDKTTVSQWLRYMQNYTTIPTPIKNNKALKGYLQIRKKKSINNIRDLHHYASLNFVIRALIKKYLSNTSLLSNALQYAYQYTKKSYVKINFIP